MKRQSNLFIVLLMTLLLSACPNGPISQYPNAGLSTYQVSALLPHHPTHSTWVALSRRFILNDNADHPLIREQIQYLIAHPAYLHRLTQNAGPYLYYVYTQTEKRHMPGEIALLPMIESNYNPFGVSPSSGATGLWQMMRGTASGYGVKMNWWYDGRRDIVASTNAALNYLETLHHTFNNNWLLAIAAYNAGAETVILAIKHNQSLGRPTDYWALPLPNETKTYLPKLFALANVISNASIYHVTLPKIPNHPYFKTITVHNQVNIKRIAQLSKTSTASVRELNPGLRNLASSIPGQSYTLLLPEDKSIPNLTILNQPITIQPHQWMHHLVQPGDSLYALADKYHLSVSTLETVNHLHTDLIHPGKTLLIPLHHTAHHEAKIAHMRRYTVKRGDTLSKIAKQFHTTVRTIKHANHLSNDLLKEGLVLTIP